MSARYPHELVRRPCLVAKHFLYRVEVSGFLKPERRGCMPELVRRDW